MKTMNLSGIWQLKGRQQEGGTGEMLSLQAQVPGCVQLDLSKAGYLPEALYMGENIREAEKYEEWEWWYERTFTAPQERENVWLIFEGVDCVAEYFLNGKKFGESENMLIAHEFEIGSYLQDGENTLTVHISSPVIAAHQLEYTLNAAFDWGNSPVQTGLRRAPHSYGWDIMPRAVTSGLWRGVRLEVRDTVRFSQLFFRTTDKTCDLFYEISGKWSDCKDLEIEAVGSCGEDNSFSVRHQVTMGKAGRFSLPIENPKSWWPYGYGEANVYDAVIRIYQKGELLHTQRASFGLRTVELDRTDSTDGVHGQFRFLINGVEIMCKGSNWVPMDAFHCRDAQRYGKALELVKDIGCNILRCWGGNVYEDHAFYDFCDRNGVMVWQDFSMACRTYPRDERYQKLLREEATAVIRKLRNHPSIILWGGDNEIDQMMAQFGFAPSENLLTRRILPEVIAQNDMDRPYLPSSPYINDEVFHDKTLSSPEDHVWGPRDYFKSSYYKENRAHFISEIGYHGCPSLESIKKFITPEKVWPYQNNAEWILHSSDQVGNDSRVMLMEKQVRQFFGEVPTDPEEYILASQISQAEAKKYFIERMRIRRPQKTGIIWWNLIDGWPQMSDAVVDYYYEKKLAYRYIKRSQAPFVIAADEISHWNMKFYACNDTLTEKKGTFRIIAVRSGDVLHEGEFTAPANTSTCIAELPVFYSQHRMTLIEWEIDGEKGFNHYLCGFPPFSMDTYTTLMKKAGL